MATTAITLTQLVTNTLSSDILDANGTVADTPGDGWAVALGSRGTVEKLVFKFLTDGSGDTVVFTAGDSPLAKNAAKGSLSVVLAASDVRYVAVESGRFEQDDGTIVITCGNAASTIRVFAMPVGIGGGSGIA